MTSYLHVSVRGMLTNSCYAMPKYDQGHVHQQHIQGYFLQPYTTMFILDNGINTSYSNHNYFHIYKSLQYIDKLLYYTPTSHSLLLCFQVLTKSKCKISPVYLL